MSIFCSKCGVENTEDAKYCQECGNEIVKYPSSDSKHEGIKSDDQNFNKKSPLGAAVLNLIIAGIGFVYIRKW